MKCTMSAILILGSMWGNLVLAAPYQGFGTKSLSPEILEKYKPRPLAPELKNEIEMYMDLHFMKTAMLSPKGDNLYVAWPVTGTPQIWKIDKPLAYPMQLTGGDNRAELKAVSADGQWIAINRDTNSDEFYGVYLVPAKGGPLKKVYRKDNVRAEFQGFSDDSAWVYFNANDKEKTSYAVYRYNIKSGKTETLFTQPGLWKVEATNGNNELILSLDKGSMHSEHFLYEISSKKLTPIIGQNLVEDYQVEFAPKKGEYIVLTNQLRDYRSLYLLKAGKLEPIVDSLPYDITEFEINSDRSLLAYKINNKGYSQPKAIETSQWKPVAIPELKGVELVHIGPFSADGNNLPLLTESSQSPGDTYSYNFKTKKLTQWDRVSTPEIQIQKFVTAKLESYKAEDGTDIPMFVWRTRACEGKICPVIVLFHGGPEAQLTPKFNPNIHALLAKGFVVAAPNVRGSDGYGKKWLMADNGPKRLGVVTDIRDAARHIKKNWKVKGLSPKIGIYGGSYGGYSTLTGMTMFAGEYDAGVAVVGMSSLNSFLENTAPYRRQTRINEYGDPVKDKDALTKLSPITYVDKVKDPVLVLHGLADPRVPAGEALQFMELVKDQSPKSELVIFPDEGHGFTKRSNKVLSLGYLLEFFEKNLN